MTATLELLQDEIHEAIKQYMERSGWQVGKVTTETTAGYSGRRVKASVEVTGTQRGSG